MSSRRLRPRRKTSTALRTATWSSAFAHGPNAEILVDGRQPPLEVFFGKRPGDANIEIVLAANLLHSLWLGKESTREAFFSGQIKTRGNMLKMMKLTELFYECEKVYPAIAAAHGLL